VRLWSRNARNWALSFPRIVEAMTRLPGGNLTLEGEAVCLREDGRPDFRTMLRKRGARTRS
jgi:ATP-dependent DNA ligase